MKALKLCVPVFAGLLLAGCGSDNNDMMSETPPPTPPATEQIRLKVTAVNLTYGQPLSPIGIALHKEGQFWKLGEAASVELEKLAEGGDNSGLLGLEAVMMSSSADAPLAPGASQELMLTTESLVGYKLSLITMMVNTNDGFTGLNAMDVSNLAEGDSVAMRTYAYDAGTEANTEAQGTIPGPADGGEGFNSTREAIDKVAMHPGVVGNDDGLSSSILDSTHKFDNPLMLVTITRMK
ncbi:spondin domain-containing protein [Pseudoalteromonas xiamenensis]|uniref:spondin domain-containing protein n=1 Tax=Pseudoalteromonas xiamenensis TaxID=882626 RepID=UPI0027E42256|nr:spondin domain-containing protein [Pseudoalteromonas xiamenensis]WMN60897.1 spondin domain-containing protein [Pseudoalteromonas xiamenensis]